MWLGVFEGKQANFFTELKLSYLLTDKIGLTKVWPRKYDVKGQGVQLMKISPSNILTYIDLTLKMKVMLPRKTKLILQHIEIMGWYFLLRFRNFASHHHTTRATPRRGPCDFWKIWRDIRFNDTKQQIKCKWSVFLFKKYWANIMKKIFDIWLAKWTKIKYQA